LIGADWSELHEGTNGIGTCISVDRPVTVHRSEHFRVRHIGLSCSGSPIHDPSGSLLAVLDASTVNARDTRSSQAHTMALVNMSAQLIEKCIFLQHHHGATIVRFHARPELVNLLHDGSMALAGDGTIVAVDAMAVRLLAARNRHDLVGRKFEQIFDARIEDLLAPVSLARQALWPLRDAHLGRRYFASLHVGGTPHTHTPILLPPTRTVTPTITAKAAAKPTVKRTPHTLTFADLAGNDPQMAELTRKASRIANSTLSVLIQGPTGSGKECFARALHAASPRQSQPFIAVNCAALPETLIESELFGYGPGAFTGARKEGRKGRIVQASGGTLFLDEIGDMPLHLQTRLLRVLEEQEVTPLGAETGVPVDLRILCASNRDLRELVVNGEFRDDLYYRLNGIVLELPALAARSDKEQLIRRCLAETGESACAIDPAALRSLSKYTWPGNFRELHNVLRSASAICDNNVILCQDLPAHVTGAGETPRDLAPAPEPDSERSTLMNVIRANRGNLCHTAKQLGISRNALYRRLKRHRIAINRVDGLSVDSSAPQ
jgi:transcriptional regulator of acetoin/glycerol metabolism